MILKNVKIENFRSIKNEIINFEEDKCKILVGINEAGKSNVLKAMNALTCKYGREHIRRPSHGEDIEDYKIEFEFKLTQEEKETIYNGFKDVFFNLENEYFVSETTKEKVNLTNILNNLNVTLIRTAGENIKYISNIYEYSFGDIVCASLKEDIEDELPENYKNTQIYFSKDEFKQDYYNESELDFNNFIEKLNEYINEFTLRQVEKVVFWEFKEENIMPSEIRYEEFLNNPSINKTLQSLFEICQKENWNKEILKKIDDRAHINSYLKNTYSKTILEYFKLKWPELKLKDFEIIREGEFLRFSFIDQEDNQYNTQERSDGFKRFITFLILISGKNALGEIKDTILIIDEPDIAIHISGQKYLLQELLNISENNIVIFSTHSPFMIDKSNIGRHYIVSKSNEETKLTISTESNYSEEEVLFNALGYTIFCNIKNKNVLFEGYWDNKVFKLLKGENFNSIGHVYMGGVKNAQFLAKTIEIQEKDYVIISDSDRPAQDKKKEFLKECDGIWTEYGSIVDDIYTLEDFVENRKLKAALNQLIRLKEYATLKNMNVSFVDALTNKKLDVITKACLKVDNGIDKKILQNKLKERIFKNIEVSDITETYQEVLAFIEKI